jgi:hypothetical protein
MITDISRDRTTRWVCADVVQCTAINVNIATEFARRALPEEIIMLKTPFGDPDWGLRTEQSYIKV